ncbi:MAG: hypothetical protein ACHQ15_03360, partial [Candidatus Limnocylindrales bacterium]
RLGLRWAALMSVDGDSPRPGPVPGRPAGLGDVLDALIRLYRRQGRLLLGICAVVEIPVFVVSTALSARLVTAMTSLLGFSPLDPPATMPTTFPPFDPAVVAQALAVFGTLVVVGLVSGAVTTAGLALAVADVVGGRLPSILGTLRRLLRLVSGLIVGEALFLLVVGGLLIAGSIVSGALLGLVPDPAGGGILVFIVIVVFVVVVASVAFLALRLGFWPQVMALEGRSAPAALRRSWQLVTGSTWRVLGYTLILVLADWTLTLLLSQLGDVVLGVAGSSGTVVVVIGVAWNVALTILVAPILPVGLSLLFLDLRRPGLANGG